MLLHAPVLLFAGLLLALLLLLERLLLLPPPFAVLLLLRCLSWLSTERAVALPDGLHAGVLLRCTPPRLALRPPATVLSPPDDRLTNCSVAAPPRLPRRVLPKPFSAPSCCLLPLVGLLLLA